MSSYSSPKNQESPYIKALRKYFSRYLLRRDSGDATRGYTIEMVTLNPGAVQAAHIPRDIEEHERVRLLKDIENKIKDYPAYAQQMQNIKDHCFKFLYNKKIKNRTIKVTYLKENQSAPNYYFETIRIDLKPDDEDLDNIDIDKILMDRGDRTTSQAFDISCHLDIFTDMVRAAAGYLDFVPEVGATEKTAMLAGTGAEIIEKNTKDKTVRTETDLLVEFEDQLSWISQTLRSNLLRFLELESELKRIRYEQSLDTHTDPAVTEILQKNESAVLDEAYSLFFGIRDGIGAQIKKISKILPHRQTGYSLLKNSTVFMPRSTEYSVSKLANSLTRRSYEKSHFQFMLVPMGPIGCVAANVVINDVPFYATAGQISDMARAEDVLTLFNDIDLFLRNLQYLFSRTGFKETDQDYISGGVSGAAAVTYGIIENVIRLGVRLSSVQKIINKNLLKNKNVIKTAAAKSESPSLKKFLNKIGMSIDISNTARPSAESAISARLRQLGKELSQKYGVSYDSNPGNVVLSAMRRADDIDEIMLSISTALEDCFGIIESAEP